MVIAYGGALARGGRDGVPDDFTRGFAPTFFPGNNQPVRGIAGTD
jgi:hypothetical protein